MQHFQFTFVCAWTRQRATCGCRARNFRVQGKVRMGNFRTKRLQRHVHVSTLQSGSTTQLNRQRN